MSKTVFTVADPHFTHAGVCKFEKNDGTKLRPWACPLEMDEALVENWNTTIRPQDKVYVLGDITMSRKPSSLEILSRLNGDKVLIGGNHDILSARVYLQYFRDVRAVHVWDKCVLTHVPVHPDSLSRWRFNVHGHLHSNEVMLPGGENIDPRYLCVSMEQPWINFKPIEWTEAMKLAQARMDESGMKHELTFHR